LAQNFTAAFYFQLSHKGSEISGYKNFFVFWDIHASSGSKDNSRLKDIYQDKDIAIPESR
jgi:hypothetical protein